MSKAAANYHYNSAKPTWSIATLRQLLSEAGFQDIRFVRVGRIPPLAKSMVAVSCKT